MKVSDYIVDFFIQKNITDVFGYPGGMVTHLMESFRKRRNEIRAHVNYHEQAVAFAACGYAQSSGKPGVAYATSGPGATNLITGICNAYFDSVPVIFITGQVNTYEEKGSLSVRQRGFQETDIVSMVEKCTKYSVSVKDAEDIPMLLDKAYDICTEGRKGPVLLDIPMNILRADIEPHNNASESKGKISAVNCSFRNAVTKELQKSLRPCLLLGNGVKNAGAAELAKQAAQHLGIPCVTSMIACDVLSDSLYNYGFIGAYGDRSANFIVAKSDLIICIGARMDVRQVGAKRENFAPDALIIRTDIDSGELEYPVHENEMRFVIDAADVLRILTEQTDIKRFDSWIDVCSQIRTELEPFTPKNIGNELAEEIGKMFEDNSVITADVGQNQVWVAQSVKIKSNQILLFSGGHGAMGYSLPAAIGAYYGSGGKTVYSVSGDGGFQMNIQELQYIAREHLPIKMVVMNNGALGMIRHFQEMYFDSEFFQTKPEGGYTSPDFCAIASAYGIPARKIKGINEITDEIFGSSDGPELIEVIIEEDTYVFPKLEFGKPNQDQEPLIDRNVYERLMRL